MESGVCASSVSDFQIVTFFIEREHEINRVLGASALRKCGASGGGRQPGALQAEGPPRPLRKWVDGVLACTHP